ncbi:MAG: cobyrinate a,c-diamide synthase [Bdellovibrionota bacterium]
MSDQTAVKSVPLPRVLMVGTHQGVGVSTVVLGLVVCCRRQTIGIGSAKIGPSLAEPTHHRRVMSRLSYTLDSWLQNRKQIRESLVRLSSGTELAIFEGVGGLYDSLGSDSAFATQAELAKFLGAPVVLVVDARGYAESIAAEVFGFCNYDPQVQIAGVIANRVKNDEHNQLLKAAIESLGGPAYLGGVAVGDPHQTGGTLVGLHLYNPSALTRNRVIGSGNLVQAGVDLDAFRRAASAAPALQIDAKGSGNFSRLAKIAVADDQAFHLTVQDNLDMIRRVGGELVAFSPIADRKIPTGASAIYLPGGYVQLYAADLANNRPMLEAIRQFVHAGGLLYAEAGAIAYLSKKATLFNGSTFEMVGVLPGAASAIIDDADVPKVIFEETSVVGENIIGSSGDHLRGFRDNRWALRLESPVETCLRSTERGMEGEAGNIPIPDGFAPRPNVFITRLNLHWGSHPDVCRRFVENAAKASSTIVKE